MNERMRENRLRGSDAYPFALYQMPDSGQPLSAAFHWQDDVEILSIKSGETELTLEGAATVLHAGDIVCINPGQLHGFHGLTPDAACDILIFPLEHLLFAKEDHDQNRFLCPLADGKYGFPLYLAKEPAVRQLLLRAIELQKQKPAAYEMMTKALLLQVIAQLAQSDMFLPLQPTRHGDICKEILTFIHQHYMEKLTVPDVAAAVGISPTYFSTFFAEHFFQHFAEYLRGYRIEQACAMLVSTSMSVTEIALATGFNSGSHFICHFRKFRGITPLAYRKKHEALSP